MRDGIGDTYRTMEGKGDVLVPHTPAKTENEFYSRWNLLDDLHFCTFEKYNSSTRNVIIESLIGKPCSIKWGRHLMIQISGYKIETSPIISIDNTVNHFIFETEDGKFYTFRKKG